MAFTIPGKTTSVPDTPEEIISDLRNRKIKGLLAHQADSLRKYYSEVKEKTDIAMQMPTGSGKTLVALSIAEWRRRKYKERVVYLCPTRQLATQVCEQATEKYGIHPVLMVGKQSEFSPEDKKKYQNAEAVAVTTYSGIFNQNPFFSDPGTIILDDAHSAESTISKFWTVEIESDTSEFEALVSLLSAHVSESDAAKWTSRRPDFWDEIWIEKLPLPVVADLEKEIVQLLDVHQDKKKWRFEWRNIRDHLTACNIFYSKTKFVIRPLIPPTKAFAPFEGAKQRIYMTATLGKGGDLERITGRPSIVRIPVSETWKNRGIGRRLFFFPEQHLDSDELTQLFLGMIKTAKRALLLVPSNKLKTKFEDFFRSNLSDFQLITASQLEESKRCFVNEEQAVAVVANRYDGIDLEEDDCRLLLICGLPKAINFQERFFSTRLAADSLLKDRMTTRITQAVGRCTRSETDYSAVVVFGDELLDYMLNPQKRNFLHPELQAEIEFGLAQTASATANDAIENLKIFLNHSYDWDSADRAIIEMRGEVQEKSFPGSDELEASVSHEVKFQYDMWSKRYLYAFENARSIIGMLSSPHLKGYRTWWNYLAGCALHCGGQTAGNPELEYFEAAAKSSDSISWFSSLSKLGKEVSDENKRRELDLTQIERIEEKLKSLGVKHNANFEAEIKTILDWMTGDNTENFEQSQVKLGELLGFDTGKEESSASPDPWWIMGDRICVVFEAHSGANSTSEISATKARQAATHRNWIESKTEFSKIKDIIPVLVTPCSNAGNGSVPHLNKVAIWSLVEYEKWTRNAIQFIRDIRNSFAGTDDETLHEWRIEALGRLQESGFSSSGIKSFLKTRLGKLD